MFSTNEVCIIHVLLYYIFSYRVDVNDYAEVNQKQDDVVLQQNEAYIATSTSTNDKQQQ